VELVRCLLVRASVEPVDKAASIPETDEVHRPIRGVRSHAVRIASRRAAPLNIATVVFMAVTALFILINMAKFVSEGKREIGIYRAIGATKGDIRLLFILQTLAYIILSLFLGAVIGSAVIFGISNLMVTQANYLINTLVGSTVSISGSITTADFLKFDLQTLGIYTGAMLLITLIVSLIPSGQAAKVSPIEAIRNA
ncbi:MAG: FtsX-like permease family protein, partial [bacterium]